MRPTRWGPKVGSEESKETKGREKVMDILNEQGLPQCWLPIGVRRFQAVKPRRGEDWAQFVRVYELICAARAAFACVSGRPSGTPTASESCQECEIAGRHHPERVTGRHHPESVTGRHHPESMTGRHHPMSDHGRHHPVTGRHHPESMTGRHHPESVTGRHHPMSDHGRHHPVSDNGRHYPERRGQRPSGTPTASESCHRFCMREQGSAPRISWACNGAHDPSPVSSQETLTLAMDEGLTGRGSAPSRESQESIVRDALERTCVSMQRRLLGHILYRIERAQKFLARWVYSEDGLPAKYQRLIVWVNGYIIPWARALSRLTDEPTLGKLARWWELEGMPSERKACDAPYAVYARLNLRTDDLYIGQTDNWQRRQMQHIYQTFRHSTYCKTQCRRCGEHHKYCKQRVVAPHQWITVPIASCAEYVEARRLEWVLYSRWGASLNAREQPRWLIKESYSNDLKSRKRCTRKPPWRKGTRDSVVPGHLLTRYTVDGESTHRFDLRTISAISWGT